MHLTSRTLLTMLDTLQVFPNASHALLQEADINLAQLLRQKGFYVTRRDMSAPMKKRVKGSFGSPAPIEKPTLEELDYYTQLCSCPVPSRAVRSCPVLLFYCVLFISVPFRSVLFCSAVLIIVSLSFIWLSFRLVG